MASGPKKRTPLVADKRTFREKPKPKPGAGSRLAAAMTPGKSKKSARRSRPKPAAKSGNFVTRFVRWLVGGVFRIIWWVTFRVAVVLALIIGGVTAYYYARLPDNAVALMDDRARGSVTMLDHEGQVFAWRGDQFGGVVDVNSVAPQLRNAVLATEDKRFYSHLGVSPRGIVGAIRTNLREGRHPLRGHGGSTITQQVAKRVYFSDLGSIERKLKEVPMAFAMELKYTKDEILTIYMNRAYLGAGSHGFEAASQRYFSKSASEVTVAEAAMLAGLLKAPSSTAPTNNIGRAQNRANLIIGLMEDQGLISAQLASEARGNPAQLSQIAKARAGGYFADWVMEAGPEFILKDTTEDLVIRTTFDKRVQTAAEDALDYVFENKVKAGSNAQAAIVVLSKDGAVRAIVGGRKSGNAGDFNRATQALRQTGSSFKPFIYAAALEDGWRWDTRVVDEPITLRVPGSGNWSPRNYTNDYRGEMSLTDALASSINTVAVKVSEAVGRERVKETAQAFGIVSPIADGPAIALGASEATLLEMTGAYAGILNGGVAAAPYAVDSITLQGDDDPVMARTATEGTRVISEKAAGQLVYMMNQVIARGSGRRALVEGLPMAGKTGTTQGARDAWFIGFTADYVAGVWMGYDDNTKLTGVTGGGLPAEIWRETIVRVHEGQPTNPLPMYQPPTPQAEPRVAERGNNALRDIAEQVERDLKEAEREAQGVLNKVIEGLFGGNR